MAAATDDKLGKLTERQREVYDLFQDGRTPSEIGEVLDLSSSAVQGHLSVLRSRRLIPKGRRGRRRGSANGRPAEATTTVRRSTESATGHVVEIDGIPTLKQSVAEIDAKIEQDQATIAEIEEQHSRLPGLTGEVERLTHLREAIETAAQEGSPA